MADLITKEDLENASLDAATIGEFVNGDETVTVLSRLGESYPSMAKLVSTTTNTLETTRDDLITDTHAALDGIANTMLTTAASTGAPLAKDTLALLTAVTAEPNGRLGYVTNDSTLQNNGLYKYNGSSWVKSVDWGTTTLAVQASLAELTLKTKTKPVTVLGVATGVTLAAGTNAAINNIYMPALSVTSAGTLDTFELWAANAGTINRVIMTSVDNTNFVIVNTRSFTVTAGYNILTDGVALAAGQYIGIQQTTQILTAVAGASPFLWRNVVTSTMVGGTFSGATTTMQFRFNTSSFIDVSGTPTLQPQVTTLKNVVKGSGLLSSATMGVAAGITLTSGTNSAANNIWMLANPIATSGTLDSFELWAGATGTVNRVILTSSDNTNFVIVSSKQFSLSAGYNSLTDGIDVSAGQYVGIQQTSQIVQYVAGASPFLVRGVPSATMVGGTTFSTLIMQFRFNLSAINSIGASSNSITLHNVDRIGIVGDSLSASAYALKGKNWISKVSLFSDYNFESMGFSGDTFTEQLTKIRSGTILFGGLGWKDYAVTHALIMLGVNDAAVDTTAQMAENARQVIETVKGLGARVILSTEFIYARGSLDQTIYKQMAANHGAYFCNLLPHTRKLAGGIYTPFYVSIHGGTRTNSLIADPVEKFINKELDRPRQSIKIFRKRTQIDGSAVANLMFNSNYERASLFKEIATGHTAITAPTSSYYDTLTPSSGYSTAVVNSEYLALMSGGTVAFTNYALIDVVFNAVVSNIASATINVGTGATTAYIKSTLSTPYAASGAPIGNWVAVPIVGGVITLTNAQLSKAMRVDKLSVLLHNAAGFSMAAPTVTWSGSAGKVPAIFIDRSKATGAELLANPLLNTLTSWTVAGSVTPFVPADGRLPTGSTNCVTVNATDTITQSISYGSITDDKEVEIRISCRRFPAIFTAGGDMSTAPITEESFDYAKVFATLSVGSVTSVSQDKVGLWWNDVVFRAIMPMELTSLPLTISADSNIQVAQVSVKNV